MWVFAVVVSCFVPWCVLACGAARVPCFARVWRALLARARCCAGRGHTLSLAGPFGSMAGPVGARLWPGARQWGVCTLGGGGSFLSSRFPRLVPLSLFAGLTCLPTLFVPAGLALAGRLVLVAGLEKTAYIYA